jgi:hypothetical protein
VLNGGAGDDHHDGGNGPDQIHGGAGTNTCVDSNGPDSFTDCAIVPSSTAPDGAGPPVASTPAPSMANGAPQSETDPTPGIDPPGVIDRPPFTTSGSESSAFASSPVDDRGDPRLIGAGTTRDRPNAVVGQQDESADASPAGRPVGDATARP